MVIHGIIIEEIRIIIFIEKTQKEFLSILSKFILFRQHTVYNFIPYVALQNDLKHHKVNLKVIKEVIRLENKASKI